MAAGAASICRYWLITDAEFRKQEVRCVRACCSRACLRTRTCVGGGEVGWPGLGWPALLCMGRGQLVQTGGDGRARPRWPTRLRLPRARPRRAQKLGVAGEQQVHSIYSLFP